MKTRINVGQASTLRSIATEDGSRPSHYSNEPLERKRRFSKLETGATPVLLWLALLLLLSTINHQLSTCLAQGTTITYQGRLDDGGAPANGLYDFRFRVFDAATGGNNFGGMVMLSSVGVTNGLFAVPMTFGGGAFSAGSARWLEIGVRPGGSGGNYTNLEPRQPITAAPYAITAGNLTGAVADSQLSANIPRLDGNATFTGAVLFNNPTSQFAGTFSGDGAGVTNVNLILNSSGTITPHSGLFALASLPQVDSVNGVVAADVNGDGWPDLLTAAVTGLGTTVLTNDGRGRFRVSASVQGSPHPSSITMADVNADGRLDLLTAEAYSSGGLIISTNDGHGAFIFVTNAVPGANGLAILAADVNADSRVDVIISDNTANKLFVVFNNHPNGFIFASSPSVGVNPYSIAAADVNGDNKVDLISANSGTNTLTVLTNNGSGFFSLHTSLTVGLSPRSVVALDVNGDSKADLISANSATNTLTLLTNNGSGFFAFANNMTVGTNPVSISVADVNGDGRSDLISVNNGANTLSVLTNTGSGGFALESAPALGVREYLSGPDQVAAADVNGDGRMDLVASRYSGLVLFLNTPFEFVGSFYGHFSGSLDPVNTLGIGRTPATNSLEVEGNASKTFAGSWLANSDARIKTDIQPVTHALEKLQQVRPVEFRYTDAYRAQHPSIEDRPYLNVIAQEFQQVFPDAVKRSGDKLPNGDEILQVDTYPLTIYSAAAIRELNQKMEEQRGELKQKQTEITELKQRLEKLEQLMNQQNGGAR